MAIRQAVIRFLLWLAATIASVAVLMISRPLGILVVCLCLSGAAYLHFVLPRQHAFFSGEGSEGRRNVAFGLVAATALFFIGIGVLTWQMFPRQMTAREHLEARYSRCRDLVNSPVKSAQELKTFKRNASELVVAGREWVRLNLPPVALERYEDISGVLPISQKSDFNKEHSDLRDTLERYCTNIKEIMDNYTS